MNLFDKVLGKSAEPALTGPEGFAGILLAVMAADGYLSDEEIDGFHTKLAQMRTFESWGREQRGAMFNKLFGIVKREGAGPLLHLSAEALSPDLSQTAFAMATDLVLADGHVSDEEKQFVGQLQQLLGIPDDLAMKVIEVMMIKNQG